MPAYQYIYVMKDLCKIFSGDRTAQTVVYPVAKAHIVAVQAVGTDTSRGAGGFSSTGQK